MRSQPFDIQCLDIIAIKRDYTRVGIIEAKQQIDDGRLYIQMIMKKETVYEVNSTVR